MSIIKCFECGREVSSSALYCPHCAYPIAEHIRNAMPEMPADLRIGSVVKGTALSVKTLCEPSVSATLMCHTHGLSITDPATEKIEQIHFAQIITLKKAYYRSLYCNPIHSYYIYTPHLYLEYWHIATKRKKTLEIMLADQSSIYVRENAVYSNFINTYEKFRCASAASKAEDISAEDSVRAELAAERNRDSAAVAGCWIFFFFALMLFFLAPSMAENPHSVIATIWMVLFCAVVLVVFLGILIVINCFFRKYGGSN